MPSMKGATHRIAPGAGEIERRDPTANEDEVNRYYEMVGKSSLGLVSNNKEQANNIDELIKDLNHSKFAKFPGTRGTAILSVPKTEYFEYYLDESSKNGLDNSIYRELSNILSSVNKNDLNDFDPVFRKSSSVREYLKSELERIKKELENESNKSMGQNDAFGLNRAVVQEEATARSRWQKLTQPSQGYIRFISIAGNTQSDLYFAYARQWAKATKTSFTDIMSMIQALLGQGYRIGAMEDGVTIPSVTSLSAKPASTTPSVP